jgi:hypothetical protein
LSEALISGLTHEEFWEMTPKEVYLSIKASKAREDRHYSQMAQWVALLANASGNLKSRMKPEKLYQPNLVEAKPQPTKEEVAETWRKRRVKRQVQEATRRRIEELKQTLPPVNLN